MQVAELNRQMGFVLGARRLRLFDCEYQNGNADECGDHGDPDDRLDVVRQHNLEQHGEHRAREGANRIQ